MVGGVLLVWVAVLRGVMVLWGRHCPVTTRGWCHLIATRGRSHVVVGVVGGGSGQVDAGGGVGGFVRLGYSRHVGRRVRGRGLVTTVHPLWT